METKVPLGGFTTDVAPLPSAPPPSYDDACATASHIYPVAPILPLSTPLITESHVQGTPAPVNAGNLPYPAQQVHITPAAMAATAAHGLLPVGRQPLKTTCTVCRNYISTRIRVKNRFSATFWCILLCLTCVCIPCSCCPYFCCDHPMRIEHFCPRCNAFLGTYVERT